MKRYNCVCGNTLFFENSLCVSCKRDVGWCPTCKQITALEPAADGNGFTCQNKDCGAHLLKCDNYVTHNVCNRCVPVEAAEASGAAPRCDYCRFNRTIPKLDVPTNLKRWGWLEAAKRRALHDFDRLGLKYGMAADGVNPPLAFEFKADSDDPAAEYQDVSAGEKVFTGHDNGLITINLKEADPVERERARVDFREAHRTLVGHFRHELGHYVWDVSVKGEREPAFNKLFGDANAVPYGQALAEYHKNGAKPDWATAYVSAYATMHPWEDWAETFAHYLSMMATMDTAVEGKLVPPLDLSDFGQITREYARLGLALNELNRGIGLVDFLPEVIVGPVCEKMAFVHGLTRFGGA
ncbi:MAG: hypothetical protein JWO31_172 [Phycisphaerales bacterium]|nr:hypothetical protein [Phycisphaerales bacterium]